jgi:hypothetical protein
VKHYLERLAARLVEPRTRIRPRPVSRFEATDLPTAPVEEAARVVEEEASPAPPLRERPARLEVDRGDPVPQAAPETPPMRTEPIARPAGPRPAPVVMQEVSGQPAAHDTSMPAPRDVRTPTRHDLAPAVSEPIDAQRPHPPASKRAIVDAMPFSLPYPSPRPGTAHPAAPVPLAPTAPIVPDAPTLHAPHADRILPWRAPDARVARPAIDTRTAAHAPISGPPSQRHDKAGAAAPAEETPGVVQVTIGRLEVRAPETPRRPFQKPARAAPRMSLQDYLQRRTEGRDR